VIRFQELFRKAGVVPDTIEGDANVLTMAMDSRKVVPGCCFVCMPSESTDSHVFLLAAKEAGAVAAIAHSQDGFNKARELGLATALIYPGNSPTPSPRSDPFAESETPEQRIRRTTGRFSDAMWRLAKVAFADPSKKLKVIGVTGTNGKTTTAWLIRDMLNLLGVPCAYIGTLGFGLPRLAFERQPYAGTNQPAATVDEELRPLANTTPFSIELNAMLAEAVERGCKAVAMEVSSHALAERRVDGVEFEVAVFTNLTQDHLDYHGTMEAYEAAKWKLCERAKHGVLHADDAIQSAWVEERLKNEESLPRLGYWSSVEPGWDIFGTEVNVQINRISMMVYGSTDPRADHMPPVKMVAPLGGDYNVENLICATTVTDLIGFPPSEIAAISPNLRPVPGRFEPVPNDSGIGIIVDYAHTPDALEKLLATVRPLTKGKVITVFGCGGDRDKTKRPLMARAAQVGSDIVVVTSDNPRTEDPMEIIREILDGLVGSEPSEQSEQSEPSEPSEPSEQPIPSIRVEPDRPAAVALAIKLAVPGDTVVIAGKGHENYQIIGRTKFDMDDRDLARRGLSKRN